MIITSRNALVVRNNPKRITMIQVSSNNHRLLICSFLVLNASTVIRIPLIMHHIPKITTKSAAINSQISGNSKRIIQKII
jgi:hypothetical protein